MLLCVTGSVIEADPEAMLSPLLKVDVDGTELEFPKIGLVPPLPLPTEVGRIVTESVGIDPRMLMPLLPEMDADN